LEALNRLPEAWVARQVEALADFDRAIAQGPKNSWALAHRGQACCLMGRYDEALADLDRAIALNPDYGWALARRGETWRLMERYDEALVDFDRAIALKPAYAWALAHRGETHRLMGCYDEALDDLNRAIALNPAYAWAFACRCLLHEQWRRYEQALQDLDRTVALDETIFSAWRSDRGLLLSFCGRYAQAIAWCEGELREQPENALLLYALAVTQARWRGLAEARSHIARARQALRTMVEVDVSGAIFYRLGGLAALEGQSDRALRYLRQATHLRGGRFETACHDLAWLNLRSDPRFQALIPEPPEVQASKLKRLEQT
jgi:tetratricopeptide (TPR) repeat protein